MRQQNLEKAAQRGEPSYVWRAGQERRFQMIQQAAGERARGNIFIDGCGVGSYLSHLALQAAFIAGLDIEFPRTVDAYKKTPSVVCGAGETLPFPSDSFDLILSHEVLEHVQNDRLAIREMVRTLKTGGRLTLFCPNRGYPFETHGIFWKGRYHFGNIPLVNWLPRPWRDRLAPHVRVYSSRDLEILFDGLPVRFVERRVVFGAYDNIIARFPGPGRFLRALLQALERTPLQFFGLSHFWVVEKV